jgi:hypothetical protein
MLRISSVFLGLGLTLAGCGTPAKLDLRQAAPVLEQKLAIAAAPLVHIAPAQDIRSNREDLGIVGGRPFSGSDLSAWINQTMLRLGTEKFRVSTSQTIPHDTALEIYPRLVKAYVDSITTSKTAVIVLEVVIIRPDGSKIVRHFRGQDAGVNWSSSEGEVVESLRRALARCGMKMRSEIETLLRPEKTAT